MGTEPKVLEPPEWNNLQFIVYVILKYSQLDDCTEISKKNNFSFDIPLVPK